MKNQKTLLENSNLKPLSSDEMIKIQGGNPVVLFRAWGWIAGNIWEWASDEAERIGAEMAKDRNTGSTHWTA